MTKRIRGTMLELGNRMEIGDEVKITLLRKKNKVPIFCSDMERPSGKDLKDKELPAEVELLTVRLENCYRIEKDD